MRKDYLSIKILMFKSVRLYLIVTFVTRTNFDICRCWTILGIARGALVCYLAASGPTVTKKQHHSLDLHHCALYLF